MSTKPPSNINMAEMSMKPPQIQNSASSLPSVFLGRIDRCRNVDEAAFIDIHILNPGRDAFFSKSNQNLSHIQPS
jgi:hypothetical protein